MSRKHFAKNMNYVRIKIVGRTEFYILATFFLLTFFATLFSIFALEVVLVEPQDNTVLNATNSITFVCNVSDSYYIKNVSLYHNISGSFRLEKTKKYGEVDPDNSTVLLMHFNNNSEVGENDYLVYDWSGNGNNGTVFGPTFNSSGGKFFGSFEFDGISDNIVIEDSDILDIIDQLSIEFWVRINDISNQETILAKGDAIDTSPYSFLINPDKSIIFYVVSQSEEYTYVSSTSLEPYEFYHIVGTWKYNHTTGDSMISLYVNGNLEDYRSETGVYPPLLKNDYNLIIGQGPGYGNFNGTIDELVIYNRTLTEDEILEHYYSGILTNETSQNWTIENVPDGLYSWNCLAYNYNLESKWSDSNRTFWVDRHTPPTIENITLSPSSEDDIDPDVEINITAKIKDPSGVNTAIFMYKRGGLATWNNVTMNYLGENTWNASFVPSSPPDTWNFKIWANDSTGNAGSTIQYNLSVDYDYSWKTLPENFGEVWVPVTENGTLGVLIINNTGDYPLNFRLSSTWENTFYNITNYNSFDVNAKETKAIQINVTAPQTAYEYTIQILVEATNPNAKPKNTTINATLVAFVSGPYFLITPIYSPMISQGETFNLTATVRNIGSDNATDVWLMWRVPEGWVNTSGNTLQYLSNISSNERVNSTLTIYLDPTKAVAGLSTVYVDVNCSENVDKTVYFFVNVNCNNYDGICGAGCTYASDMDCPMPKGKKVLEVVAASAVVEYKFLLSIPERVDIYRNQTGSFYVIVNNPKENNIEFKNVTLIISGYPQVHIKKYPEIFEKLKSGETKIFEIELFAPSYMSYGEYEMNVSVVGFTLTKRIVSSGKIILGIHSITENETIEEVKRAEEAIREMKKLNLSTEKIEKNLQEAKKALEEWDFDRAKELADEIISTKEKSISVFSTLNEIVEKIREANAFNIKTPETEKMYFLALSAMLREDYPKAEERAKNALLAYMIEAKNINTIKFLHKYWWAIISSSFVISIISLLSYRSFVISSLSKNIKFLSLEEKTIEKLIKKAQIDFFIKNALSKSEYLDMINEYKKRLTEVRMKKISLLSKKIGFLKLRKRESLLKEREQLKKLILKTQEKYFKLGEMSKEEYTRIMKDLEARTLEINKELKIID